LRLRTAEQVVAEGAAALAMVASVVQAMAAGAEEEAEAAEAASETRARDPSRGRARTAIEAPASW